MCIINMQEILYFGAFAQPNHSQHDLLDRMRNPGESDEWVVWDGCIATWFS